MSLPKISDLTKEELRQWAIHAGEKPFRANQLFTWFFAKKESSLEGMSNLSKSFKEKVAKHFDLEPIQIDKKIVATDGTIKFGQRLSDGRLIESVLLRHDDHNTLCISTQVGCAMACRFCLTATMGLVRNLTPGEIVDQVINAYSLLPEDETLRNIVYMGMGEPFHNYENTLKSLDIFLDPEGLAFSSRRITISTSGLIPEIRRFGMENKLKANLAISLNGVTQKAREELMPIGKRYKLKELMEVCKEFPSESRKRITFEYILIDSLTDSMESARQLVTLLHGIKSKVNLIPFNEHPDLQFRATSKEQIKNFQQYLLDHGITATLRSPRGLSHEAACGHLATEETRLKAEG